MKIVDPAVITATLFNKELHTDLDPLEIIRRSVREGSTSPPNG